jgi:hypothetical protein
MTTQNVLFLSVLFIIPAIGAYVSVYSNVKLANGNIIPGWFSLGLLMFYPSASMDFKFEKWSCPITEH